MSAAEGTPRGRHAPPGAGGARPRYELPGGDFDRVRRQQRYRKVVVTELFSDPAADRRMGHNLNSGSLGQNAAESSRQRWSDTPN